MGTKSGCQSSTLKPTRAPTHKPQTHAHSVSPPKEATIPVAQWECHITPVARSGRSGFFADSSGWFPLGSIGNDKSKYPQDLGGGPRCNHPKPTPTTISGQEPNGLYGSILPVHQGRHSQQGFRLLVTLSVHETQVRHAAPRTLGACVGGCQRT